MYEATTYLENGDTRIRREFKKDALMGPAIEAAKIDNAVTLIRHDHHSDPDNDVMVTPDAHPGASGLPNFYVREISVSGDVRKAIEQASRMTRACGIPEDHFTRQGGEAQLSDLRDEHGDVLVHCLCLIEVRRHQRAYDISKKYRNSKNPAGKIEVEEAKDRIRGMLRAVPGEKLRVKGRSELGASSSKRYGVSHVVPSCKAFESMKRSGELVSAGHGGGKNSRYCLASEDERVNAERVAAINTIDEMESLLAGLDKIKAKAQQYKDDPSRLQRLRLNVQRVRS